MKIEERVMKVLQATAEQQAAIDRVFDGLEAEDRGQRAEVRTQEGSGSQPAAEPFISKRETARRLVKDVRTVTTWMRKGLLPYYKIGHTIVFKWSEVEKQLALTCRVGRPRG